MSVFIHVPILIILLGRTHTAPLPSLSCFFKGEYYPPGAEVESGYDADSNWCYGTYCSYDGNLVPWDNFECHPTTVPPTTEPTTSNPDTPETTTIPGGCLHEGKWYPPGATVSIRFDKVSDFCFVSECSRGYLVEYNTLNCPGKSSTTVTPSTPSPTSSQSDRKEESTTLVKAIGCYDDGKVYPLGGKISSEYDESSNWCYGKYCSMDGQIISWDRWNCKSTTSQPTTVPFVEPEPETTTTTTAPPTEPPTMEPTTIPGCNHEGRIYPYGAEISRGYDISTNWCHGTTCSMDGYIIAWDKPNCKPTTTSLPTTEIPTEPPTTEGTTNSTSTTEVPTEITTEIPTTSPGCFYQGQYYGFGQEVSKGYDEWSDWCYGMYCDYSGQLINWDTWNCRKTTPFPTTIPGTPEPPMGGCFFEGEYYSSGQELSKGYDKSSNWCYGTFCDYSGQIIRWDNWNCKTTPSPTSTTEATTTAPEPTSTSQSRSVPETKSKKSVSRKLASPAGATKDEKDTKTTGCLYLGKTYPQGQTIGRKCGEDKTCVVIFCNKFGSIDTLADITRDNLHGNQRKQGIKKQSTREKLTEGN